MAVSLLIFVVSIGISRPTVAATHTLAVNLRSEWERGTLTNLDSESRPDYLQLADNGTWSARQLPEPPDNINIGASFASDGNNYVYVGAGNAYNFFWRYDSQTNRWARLADTPFPLFYGADFAYANTGHVYAIFGNYLKKFARYNIASDTWEMLADTPDSIHIGASLAYDYVNDAVYLILGNSTQGFYRYIYPGSWENRPATPATMGAGSDLIFYTDGDQEYLFARRGLNTLSTYRFDLNTNPGSWSDSAVADIPSGHASNTDDPDGIFINDGYIYFPRGTATQTWMRYKIANPGGDIWTVYNTFPTFLPMATTNYSGGFAYTTNPTRIHYFRGNNSRLAWSVDPTTNPPTWIAVQDPIISGAQYTVTTGSSLISDDTRYLYLQRGGTNVHLRYDSLASGSNPWTTLSTTNAPTISIDQYGTRAGDYVYFVSSSTTIHRYGPLSGTPAWSSSGTLSTAFGNGALLLYPDSGNIVYAVRGGGQPTLYSINVSSWPPSVGTLTAMPQTNQATSANIGARGFATSTNLYVLLGNGSSRFLRYNIGTDTWHEDLPAPPFSPYFGTSIAYHSATSKAYVLAGYYKSDLYEFTVGGTWRKLRSVFKAGASDISFYTGASSAIIGSTLYALRGNGTSDFYSYTISSSRYTPSGVYESEVFDLTYVSSWNSFTTSGITRGDLLAIETRSSNDGTNWPESYTAVTGTTINSPARRYLQVRITFTAADSQQTTPVIGGYSISYVRDSTPPSNPSSITAKPTQDSQITLQSGSSYSYSSIYFEWPEVGAVGGASDGQSGVAGYYVYFGPNPNADPDNPGDGGFFTSNRSFTTNIEMSNGSYYFRIVTIDNDSTPASSIFDAFTYVYNDISPFSTLTITDQNEWDDGTASNTSFTQSSGNLQLSSNTSGSWVQESVALPPATFTIGSNAIYRPVDNKIYALRGGSRTLYSYSVSANTWSNEGDLSGVVNVGTGGGLVLGPGQYLYGWLGNNSTVFQRYDTVSQTWNDAAAEDFALPVGTGAAAAFDGVRYIYFVRGNNTNDFWRYDTNTNTWDSSFNVDTNFNNPVNQQVNGETKLVFDGNRTLYLLQSTGYSYFSKYTIPENISDTGSWTPIASAPLAFGSGTAAAYDSTTNAVYALSSYRDMFARYNISNDSWNILDSPPLTVGTSASLVRIDGALIAFRAGGTQGVWKFSIDQQVWYKPVANVFAPNASLGIYNPIIWSVGAGAYIIKGNGDNYYATRGNLDNWFIRFNRRTNEVTRLADVPHGLTSGAALAYTGSHIYATTGSNSRNFYKYSIADNSWSQVNTASTKLVPGTLADGADMAYDGSRYIYLSRGTAGAQIYMFDTTDDTWVSSGLPPNLPNSMGAGGNMVYAQNPSSGDNFLFVSRGAATTHFYYWQIGAGSWTNNPAHYLPVTVTTGGTLASGGNGRLYASRGSAGTLTEYYQFNISNNTWTQLNSAPAEVSTGAAIDGESGEQTVGFLGQGTNTVRDGIYSFNIPSSSTSFVKTGTYTSPSFDFSPSDNTPVYRWANLTAKFSQPSGTSVTIETSSSSDGSNWDAFTLVSNEQTLYSDESNNNRIRLYRINSVPREYLRVRFTLNSTGLYTPTIEYYKINYYIDLIAPNNPSSVTVYSSAQKTGDPLTDSPTWHRHQQPHFVIPTIGQAGAASDDANGSGVDGYYLYFGTDNNANPTISSGILQSGSAVLYQTTYEVTSPNSMTSGQTYYFRVLTKDKGGKTAGSPTTLFTYKFDRTYPNFITTITVTPSGWTNTDNYTFSWSTASDSMSGLARYEYRTGGDPSDSWTVVSPPTATSVTIPNYNHPSGKYTNGVNIFYVRAVDHAGNAAGGSPPSEAGISANYYFSDEAPAPPSDLRVYPTGVSNINRFTISWDPPENFTGDPQDLRYRWAVNSFPLSESNTVETSAESVGPQALATQNGVNTFYVVTKLGNNIDYNSYAYITFEINTSAPSPPTNLRLADTSERELEQYSLVLRYNPPELIPDENDFYGYKIYRSVDGGPFLLLDTVTATAYVDDNLSNSNYYYYKVTAITKSGLESDYSETKNMKPTGKYTSPPTIVASSVKTTIYARRIFFEWLTTRTRGSGAGTSFVKCGETLENLNTTAGDFAQVLEHKVMVEGLTPSTRYFCFLYSTDVDGNTATRGPMELTTAPPPQVIDVSITDITLTKARITFKTNVPASGKLLWGKTSSFDSYKEFTNRQTEFTHELTGLDHSTTYFYGFWMVTSDGDVFAQEVVSKFETLLKPVVKNIQVEGVRNVDTPTLLVTYNTNVNTTTTVYYYAEGAPKKESSNTNPPLTTDHSIEISGLLPLKLYTLEVTGTDSYGNHADPVAVQATTLSDTKPPEVINFAIQADPQNDGKTIIRVKVQTNEPTTAQIEAAQGITENSFPIIGQQSMLNVSHSISITVDAGQTYSVRVKLTDSAGNITYTAVKNISGGTAKPTAFQLITRAITKNLGWIFKRWTK